jgi:CheY-like chemotaxis protein/anti-sigma regulatory factor (Ser/Thr protein kinase)
VTSIETSGRLLLHHANDVLDIAKHDAGRTRIEKEGFRLDRLVGELMQEYAALAREHGNALRVEWQAEPVGAVFGDPVRLKQILLNYISNAIKFTRDATITLRISDLHQDGDEHLYEFRVIDHGIGMKEADMARVFDEFVTLDSTYSRKSNGSGLGLAIARRMAEAMGGAVGVASELGAGSEFWARVPLVLVTELPPRATAAAAATAAPPRPAPEPAALDVLVVEDNPINREVLKGMLKRDGHRITEAENGAIGVELAEARRFDVILMDVSMPVMDGTEATRAIRTGSGASHAAPIIAVTAHAMPDELVAFRNAGMADCLTKPIDRKTLRRMLEGIHTAPAVPPAAAAPAEPEEGEMIDRDQFAALLDSVGEEAGRALLTRFITDADASIGRLSSARGQDRPLHEVLPEVHRMAGAAGMFGAIHLKRALNRIEGEGKRGNAAEAHAQLGTVPALWSETRRALEAMATAPAPGPLQ